MKSAKDTVMEKLYEFFAARLDAFKEDDEMQKLVVQKIRKKLEIEGSEEELSFGQLMKLYEVSRSLANQQTRNIVEIVKPVPNAESPILPQGRDDDEDSGRIKISLPADQAAAADRIMRTLMQGPQGQPMAGQVLDVSPKP